MAKIPFDIKYRPQIESGEYKVVTENYEPARIICWDSTIKEKRPIIAIVFDDQIEQYKADGHYYDYGTSNYDLFIVTPEEEMTEWQRFISACLQKHGLLDCGAADRIAKESAAELLKIAEKQINSDGYLILHRCSFEDEIYHREKCASEKAEAEAKLRWYDKGVEDGKAEALKNLPRWERWENGLCGNIDDIPIAIVRQGLNYKLVSTLGIPGEQYIMLSDLEKLPGFKENDNYE